LGQQQQQQRKPRFNELDNWLELMELDPPSTRADKTAMRERLVEIVDRLFSRPRRIKKKKTHRISNSPR
jgi:hypothetical protein